MLDSAYIGVIIIGLLHGLEPSHGWPIAFLYSIRRNKSMRYGLVTSGLISSFHFVSSISVVVAYVLLASFLNVSSTFMKYVAAGLLFILAYIFYKEDAKDEFEAQHEHLHGNKEEIEHTHEHEHYGQGMHIHRHKHAKSMALSLWGITIFAFISGFAHEEEFVILALAVGGINPLMLMISYAIAVTMALIGITLIFIKAYEKFLPKIRRYLKYIPKVSAISLLIMALAFVFGFG